MSKSHKSERSRILITDRPEDIKTKIASALTDSLPGISYDIANRPGVSNLLDILSIFDAQGRSPEQLAQYYKDLGPRQLKDMVSHAVVCGLDGIRDRYLDLVYANDSHLDEIAAEGARKAQESANETIQIVKGAIGF
ncbi:Fc.00g006330.m01.CDS01 [Cosmosporella sp. VM-42]